MGRTKDYPGFASGFQLTAALIRQVQDDGGGWRHLFGRSGFLARTSWSWTSLGPLFSRPPAQVPEPHLIVKKE
jgi:hypothetical protein